MKCRITPFLCMVITVICLIIVSILDIRIARIILKSLASILFIVTAINSYLKMHNEKTYFILMLSGFIFSFGGDFFLALSSTGTLFMIGVGSFAIGHIMFICGYTYLTKIQVRDFIVFLIIFVPLLTLMLTGGFEFGEMKTLVIIYAVIISFMVSKAISMLKYYLVSKKAVRYSVCGSCLFLISDMILLYLFFYPNVPDEVGNVNLILYYLGQGILALSFGKKFVREENSFKEGARSFMKDFRLDE